jgi:hypothetical protein
MCNKLHTTPWKMSLSFKLHLCFLIPAMNEDAQAGVWATVSAKQDEK